jgi:hypothetical protein
LIVISGSKIPLASSGGRGGQGGKSTIQMEAGKNGITKGEIMNLKESATRRIWLWKR